MRVIVLVGIIVALLMVAGCAKESMTDTGATDTAPPTTAPEPTPTPTEEPEEVPAEAVELLSDVSCANKVITATVTNIGSEEVAVADIDFSVNAVPDTTPECGATEKLAAGASMTCSGLNAIGSGKNQVVLVQLSSTEKMVTKVTCETAPKAEATEETAAGTEETGTEAAEEAGATE